MDLSGVCLNCFQMRGNYDVCPYCGYMAGTVPKEAYLLHPGMVLASRYVVGTILGIGGFGVTYKAWDTKLNIVVAVKEFYPGGLVNRIPGEKNVRLFSGEKQQSFSQQLERFLDEARNMAKFTGDKHIVNVFDFFEENSTAYIVMEFLDGQTLKEHMASRGGRLPEEEAMAIAEALLLAVKTIHEKGIVHRDISPDNIFILHDGRVKVLDFGAARFAANENPELTQSVVIKLGYAPPEQYRSNMKQGSWTDIYAVGATVFKMLTGLTPDESVDRIEKDTLKRPTAMGIPTQLHIEKAIMKAMALRPELRFKSAEQMLAALQNRTSVDFPEEELKKRKRLRAILVSACVVVLLGLGAYIGYAGTRPTETTLADFEIAPDTITVSLPADDANSAVYSQLVEAFTRQYADYTVNIAEEGASATVMLLEPGEAPSGDAADLSLLVTSLGSNSHWFLSDYEAYYPKKDRMPTGFRFLTAFANEITAQDAGLSIPSSTTLAKLPDSASQSHPIGIDAQEIGYLLALSNAGAVKDGQIQLLPVMSDALNLVSLFESGQCLPASDSATPWLQVRWSDDLREMQNLWAGYYRVIPVNASDGVMMGTFTGEFAISASASENQQHVAMMFLHFMLSEYAQNALHVQQDYALPINKNALNQYVQINADYSFVTGSIGRMRITGADTAAIAEAADLVADAFQGGADLTSIFKLFE